MGRENRLAGELSPYLLMHKSNPVDWYPWGEEALTRAREQDLPIFLSVGYSTCYWCHVMERESFADAGVAQLMNEHFVNIKVDREERPEIDEIYMAATQIFNHQGGWPNSVFLTPKLEPFFAGTYFPPHDMANRPSFKTVLMSMMHAWTERRGDVEAQAEEMRQAMRRMLEERGRPAAAPAPTSVVDRAFESLRTRFDAAFGGFGRAPKFPSPANLLLLAELAADEKAEGAPDAADMLTKTLDAMAQGGIYDQLAGGFHRYATDIRWRVPHFEKMLYDNGLLMEVYALDYARTGDVERERILRETAAFLDRELATDDGAFKSAVDAEIEGREGEHHVWTLPQLGAALGEEDASFLAPIFGFADEPFFDKSYYVLHLPDSYEAQAERRRCTRAELLEQVAPLKAKLLEARLERPMPLVDDKILTDWNGLAVAGLATAGMYLEDLPMIRQAQRAASFVLAQHRDESGGLLHLSRGGEARQAAYLGDYVALVHGLLALHDATADERWREEAEALTRQQIARLWDEEQGGFFGAATSEDVLFRSKEVVDGALPAANGLAVLNLLTLARRGDRGAWWPYAEKTLSAFAEFMTNGPEGTRSLCLALRRYRAAAGEPSEQEALGSTVVGLVERASRAVVRPELTVEPADDDGWRSFRLTLTLRDGWHIYGPETAPDAELRPTTVRADGELELTMPSPESLILGDGSVEVYRGTLHLQGRLRGEPVLRVAFQPCDDRRCLPATEIEVRPA